MNLVFDKMAWKRSFLLWWFLHCFSGRFLIHNLNKSNRLFRLNSSNTIDLFSRHFDGPTTVGAYLGLGCDFCIAKRALFIGSVIQINPTCFHVLFSEKWSAVGWCDVGFCGVLWISTHWAKFSTAIYVVMTTTIACPVGINCTDIDCSCARWLCHPSFFWIHGLSTRYELSFCHGNSFIVF